MRNHEVFGEDEDQASTVMEMIETGAAMVGRVLMVAVVGGLAAWALGLLS